MGRHEVDICETCGHAITTYSRNLPKAEVPALIRLYHDYMNGIPHTQINKLPQSSGHELSRFALWGLVEQIENDDPKKKTSGFWRITGRGRRFVRCEVTMPLKAIEREGIAIGYDGDHVTIQQLCRMKGFDYQKLMQWEGPTLFQ
jgi:hypothetical protein